MHAVDGESGTPEDKYSACEVEAIADQRWAEDHLVERYAALKAELAAEADRQNPPEPEPEAAAEPAAAASEPSEEAPTPAAAFAPHEAEVAGRALYANGEEETLV